MQECVFTDELVPVTLPDGSCSPRTNIPGGTTLDSVAKLQRRSESGPSRGQLERHQRRAAALLVSSEKNNAIAARRHRRRRCRPELHGSGPIRDQKSAPTRGLTIDQIGLVELNEAFAAQAIACIRDLELGSDTVISTAAGSPWDIRSAALARRSSRRWYTPSNAEHAVWPGHHVHRRRPGHRDDVERVYGCVRADFVEITTTWAR